MYLDNVTIGGNLEDNSNDLNVTKEAEMLGLTLSNNKSEIICEDSSVKVLSFALFLMPK